MQQASKDILLDRGFPITYRFLRLIPYLEQLEKRIEQLEQKNNTPLALTDLGSVETKEITNITVNDLFNGANLNNNILKNLKVGSYGIFTRNKHFVNACFIGFYGDKKEITINNKEISLYHFMTHYYDCTIIHSSLIKMPELC